MNEQPTRGVNADTKGSRPSMLAYVIMGGALIAFVFFLILN
jgi:hypothetical protein